MVDAGGARGDDLARAQQCGAADEKLFAAEKVAQHTEGEFEDGHGQQERVGDPGELGPDRVEVFLEQAVEGSRRWPVSAPPRFFPPRSP
ncbi:hypothetical protein [Streptomyces antimycoticus]|uniref:hypothetical protein n=1 Tax=Streptomyces antimycoticus TaxID=68175 RepID=UPI001F1F34C7|nr:hypothetical protein [Streptomyces antimycoticus]